MSESKQAFYQVKWVRRSLMFVVVLAVIAASYEGVTRIHKYGQANVAAERAKMVLYAKLMNRPAWLNGVILARIVGETEAFAGRDMETYSRLANPQDKEILADVAANYTKNPALRENAWIKRVTEVRRVIDKNRGTQTIEIYAEYRRPAAWVLIHGKCYLVDDELVRLPHEYSEADRKAMGGRVMAITGLSEGVPEVGATFVGDDLAAGMKLVSLLRGKKYAAQIDAIDVSNLNGRKDHHASWIVLNTVWAGQDGKPRPVLWGRTPGEEKFWEISTAAKMKVLEDIYQKFNRIDAGKDYVDIKGDQVKVPKSSMPVDERSARLVAGR